MLSGPFEFALPPLLQGRGAGEERCACTQYAPFVCIMQEAHLVRLRFGVLACPAAPTPSLATLSNKSKGGARNSANLTNGSKV
jgi:hypothetical protein